MKHYKSHFDQLETPQFKGPWSEHQAPKPYWKWLKYAAAACIIATAGLGVQEYRIYQAELAEVEIAKQELLKLSILLNQSLETLEPIKSIHQTQDLLSN